MKNFASKKIFLIPIAIFLFAIVLINIYPKKAEASNTINVDNYQSYSDSDGTTVVRYRAYVLLDGSTSFNFSEFTLILNNLNLVSVTGLNGFQVISQNGLKYSVASNKTYKSYGSDNKLYFAEIVAKKQSNAQNCSLAIQPEPYRVLKTNNFKIEKEAEVNGSPVSVVEQGQEFDFKITVTPDVEMTSDDAIVTDEIPGEFEILSYGNGSRSGQKITWNLGKFNKGDPPRVLYVHVRAKTTVSGTFTNTAVLTVGDNTFRDDARVSVLYSEITIKKTASKKNVSNGETFYYDLVVSNTGTGVSKNVVVEDTLNSNLTFVGCDTSYTHVGQKYTFNVGTIEARGSKRIRITVKVNENNTLSVIPNTATATENGKPPVSDSDDVNVLKPSLSIVKTASVSEVKRGGSFTYQIKVTNNGQGDAINVVVRDTINSNFEITKVSTGSYNGNSFTANYPVIRSNETKTITITVKAKANATLGVIPNTATAEADNHSRVSDDEPVTVVDTNILIEKDADKKVVKPGDEVTYTIKVTNKGTGDAINLVVKDTINSNLEIISTDGASRSGNTLSWQIANLSVGASKTFTVKVRVKDVSNDMTIPNIATVKEPDKEELQDEVDIEVKLPHFTITKYALKSRPTYTRPEGQPDSTLDLKVVKPGEQFVYEIRVKNTSEVAGGPVTVTDKINDLLKIISAPEATINGQNLTWKIDNLNAGESKTFYVTVELSKDAKSGTNIPNTAVLTYKNEKEEASDDVGVVEAQVYIKKEASVKKVKPGENFYYTITVGNLGSDTATNLTITDNIPEKLIYQRIEASKTVSSGISGRTLSVNIASLAPNEEVTIKVYVQVSSEAKSGEVIKNTAVLKYEDKTYEDDDDVTVVDAQIEVKKTSSVERTIKGDEYYYTIVVSNKGEADASDLTVIDTFDERLEIIDSNNGYISGNTITWNIATLKAKSSITYTIKVRVIEGVNGDIINNKVVVKTPDKPDKEDEVKVPVNDVKISIVKSVNKNQVQKMKDFTYTLKVTNESDYDIANVLITDELDSNLIIVKTDGAVEGNTISWLLNFKAHETKTINITVKVKEECEVDKIPNTAVVSYNNDNYPSNEVVVEIVEVENPQTGNVINYTLLGGGLIGGAVIFRTVRKRHKFYRI